MRNFMRLFALIGFLTVTLTTLTSCSAMKPQDFAGTTPEFSVEEYFSGKTRGYGMFFDRFGKVQLRFTVDLEGSWDGSVLTLKEQLQYEGGETMSRVFEITKIDPHTYEVRTPDIVGVGKIEAYGNSIRWVYDLNQKIGDDIWTLSFKDWMHLHGDGIVLNRAYASKFGVLLGEVFMAVRKL